MNRTRGFPSAKNGNCTNLCLKGYTWTKMSSYQRSREICVTKVLTPRKCVMAVNVIAFIRTDLVPEYTNTNTTSRNGDGRRPSLQRRKQHSLKYAVSEPDKAARRPSHTRDEQWTRRSCFAMPKRRMNMKQ